MREQRAARNPFAAVARARARGRERWPQRTLSVGSMGLAVDDDDAALAAGSTALCSAVAALLLSAALCARGERVEGLPLKSRRSMGTVYFLRAT